MDKLNTPRKPFFKTEKDRLAHVKVVVNLLLKHDLLLQRSDFRLSQMVAKLPLENEEIDKAVEIQGLIEDILINDGYAERVAKSFLIKMTPKGRELIKMGLYTD
jgi:hypothetical protein